MTNSPTKIAIITGASGGIGRSVALRLARDGFAVVVNYAGNAVKAEGVVKEIKSADGTPSPCRPMLRTPPTWSVSLKRPWTLSTGLTWS